MRATSSAIMLSRPLGLKPESRTNSSLGSPGSRMIMKYGSISRSRPSWGSRGMTQRSSLL